MAVISKMTFDNGSTKNLIGSTFYGKCITAAATAAKTVTIGGWDESVKDNVSGATVHVYFTLGNNATSPTLNIDGGGAHPIYVEENVEAAAFPAGVYCLTLVSFVIRGQETWCWLIEAKTDWSYISNKPSLDFIPTSQKGASSGVAELDANGKVPSSQLPAYVDDVLEYATRSLFPTTGTSGIIYIATDTNLTYRWSGSDYVEISPSLALGETSSTAYRGDRGATAYSHATDSNRLTTAQNSGLYKFATTTEGHIASVTAVQKSDITGLGIPAQDTTYTFDGTYNASTNKAATVKTVTDAVGALDGNITGSAAASKTLKSFSQTNGVVTAEFEDISITKSQVSDFPASMPASDVSAWAKAATKPSYALSELTGASDVQAIEALTGTSGFLKKTAADTWSLDTTSYLPTSGGTMEGRVNLPGAPINPGFTGTGVAARDAGASASPRYFPATWTFNTGFTATDGDIFFLEVPVAGHSNGVYISVDNGQHYYPAVVQTTSRLATHYAVGNLVAFVFEADGSAASMYALNGGNDRVTVTGGVFRVFNYYDANTNTLQRTFRSTTNVELPVAGISTSSSATAAYSAISSGSYKDVYAAIPNDTAKVVSLNPSTGYFTFKALTANQAVKTDANKRLVSNNLAVTTATDETTEATRFVHSVTEDAVGKITVKTRPMPTIPNVPNKPSSDGHYILDVSSGTATWSDSPDLNAIENLSGTTGYLKKTAANTWSLDNTSYIPVTSKGAASGVAELDSNSKIPVIQNNYLYGKCTTAESTATKTVSIAGYDETTIANMEGITIFVAFLNQNTAATPTLNVNNTNAHTIALGPTNDPQAAGQFSAGLHSFTLIKASDNNYYWWLNEGRNLLPIAPTTAGSYLLQASGTGASWITYPLPSIPTSNGSYLLQKSGGGTTWTAYPLPSTPTSNGSYIMQITGETASWQTFTPPSPATIGSLTLGTSWNGNGPYTQTVTISGGTSNSKIDLQPDATVLTQMTIDGTTALYIKNNNNTFTAYAMGTPPSATITIQYTRTEVS